MGHYRPASEMPFKWRFASGPIMAPAFSGIWILSPPFQFNKKSFQSSVGPPLTNFSGSAHVIPYLYQTVNGTFPFGFLPCMCKIFFFIRYLSY